MVAPLLLVPHRHEAATERVPGALAVVDPAMERELDLGVQGLASKAREDLGEPLPLEVDGSPPVDGEGTDEEWIGTLLQAGDEEPPHSPILANRR